MKANGWSGRIAPHIHNLGIRWKWSSSHLNCFTPGKTAS